MSIVDRLVECHAKEMAVGRVPTRWRFTPETMKHIITECGDLLADPSYPEITSTTFLGLPYDVGPIRHGQPFTLD